MKNVSKIDLSKVAHSMASILENNRTQIDACTTKADLLETVKNVFSENNLDTPATKRLIANITKSRDFTSALMTVYNSYLCGSGLEVIK